MDKLQIGETAVLENGKEYMCFFETEDNGNSYAYLMTKQKPIEIVFAKQIINSGELLLEIVEEQKEKEQLLSIFQKQNQKKD